MKELVKNYTKANNELRSFLKIGHDGVIDFQLDVEWTENSDEVSFSEGSEIYSFEIYGSCKYETDKLVSYFVYSDFGTKFYLVFSKNNLVGELYEE